VVDCEVLTAWRSSGMLQHHIPKDVSHLKLNAVIKDCAVVCNKRQVLWSVLPLVIYCLY